MNWVKLNILFSILLLLVIVIFGVKNCRNNNANPNNFSDTTHTVYYEHHDTTIITKPTIINTYHHDSHTDSIEYKPSSNYDSLLNQYNILKNDHLAYNISKDSVKVDTLGYIGITDTTHKNQIIGRSVHPNLRVPVKTTTITNTIYPPQKNQFFIGPGINGSQIEPIKGINLGLIYKSKKDAIWQVQTDYDFKDGINYTLSRYFLISFKKHK